MPVTHDITGVAMVLQAGGGIVPTGTRVDVFARIYWVFLVLGTLVGVVVIGYMLYNAYKYRAEAGKGADADRPRLGELPQGSGGGRKLFLSFGMSAIIVISLIAWTYFTLLYVEQGVTQESPVADEDPIEVKVVGFQFGWRFVYTDVPGHPDGVRVTGELRVPKDRLIELNVTSDDVWHNFGVPELRVKSDAIPGQYTHQWFIAEETNSYTARCYELCGVGHSQMQATVEITTQEEFDSWYSAQADDQNVTATTRGTA